ncbi:MAG: hypothetical protein AABX29_08835 [Nanoarchaeota archaeon]
MKEKIKHINTNIGYGILAILYGMVATITIFNYFAGFIGGIWLLILGEWPIVVFGFIASFIMPWLYAIAMLPMLALVPLFNRFAERKNKILTLPIGFIGALYTNFIILLWVYLVFDVLVIQMYEQGVHNLVPLIIWAYSVTTSPLSYMARGESAESTGTTRGLFLGFIGFILTAILWFFGGFESGLYSAVFWMLIVVISMISVRAVSKEMSKKLCERCSNTNNVICYSASSTETTRDYCRVFGEFLYKEPLNLCFECSLAQDSFLNKIIMLSIGHQAQIKEAEKVWGNQAIDMLALLLVARDNMDFARRILTEEEFIKAKPWLEEQLTKK